MSGGKAVSGITSPSKIIANIFISFIGAGLLGLPYAFRESGIMEGTIIMCLVGYLSVKAMLMLIDCKYAILSSGGRTGGHSITMESKVPLITPETSEEEEFESERSHKLKFSSDLTYGDIGLYALGPAGKRLVDITIVISQIGFCCGYLIYLVENLKKHLSGMTQGQWLVLLLPPLYGLTLLRHLDKLAIFSLFAQVSNVFALTVVFWFDFSHSEVVPFHAKEVSLRGLPFFFAVSIYCYEGAGMILSLEESVAQQKKKMFIPTFVSTMFALTALYIAFGASGYLSFGPHTQQIITLNLPHGSSSLDSAALVKICLGISFFFTYPMMMFPVTHLLDKTFGFQKDKIKGNLVRLVLVLVTGMIVIAIPSFAVLASLIGATCCTMLAFIMPATFHLFIFKNRITRKQRYFNMLLIFLGVIGTVIGLWDTFHRISEQPHLVDELAQTNRPKGLHAASTQASGTEDISNISVVNVTSLDIDVPGGNLSDTEPPQEKKYVMPVVPLKLSSSEIGLKEKPSDSSESNFKKKNLADSTNLKTSVSEPVKDSTNLKSYVSEPVKDSTKLKSSVSEPEAKGSISSSKHIDSVIPSPVGTETGGDGGASKGDSVVPSSEVDTKSPSTVKFSEVEGKANIASSPVSSPTLRKGKTD